MPVWRVAQRLQHCETNIFFFVLNMQMHFRCTLDLGFQKKKKEKRGTLAVMNLLILALVVLQTED